MTATSAPPKPCPPEAAAGALPTVIIIGAMKCGTTSLHYYLGLHPEIGMSTDKELKFFAPEFTWGRGVAWYRQQFDPTKSVRGEASVVYTNYPSYRGVPERMHAVVPDARLIYAVRDPIDRIVSHYRYSVAKGKEDRPFADAVCDPEADYVARSRYYTQVERYLALYPAERLLVVEQDDLRDRRRETLREVFAFVGANPDWWDPRYQWERHRTDRLRRRTSAGVRLSQTWLMRQVERIPTRFRWPVEDAVYWPLSRPVPEPEVTADVRAYLVGELAEDAARFRAFTGRPFAHWSL